MKKNHKNYIDIAFNLAKINLGKTNSNPSVGCVVVKDNSVISTGYTSKNGRPHAEFNALNKKIDFSGSDIYVTMEPCTHHGISPPCTNIIKNKKINKVYYSFKDIDTRTAKKAKSILSKNKIKVIEKKFVKYKDFYQSYFLNKKESMPLIDAKIAISNDYYTINKKKKWITNYLSRNRVHLIRSEYDSIISTSKSINIDNSLLNCRINGFDNYKPNLIIIDLKLKIKKNLNLFNISNKRKIIIITCVKENLKILSMKKRGVIFIQIDSLESKKDFINLFEILKKKGCNRILIESGLTFLNELLKKKLIFNLYIFKSSIILGSDGSNKSSVYLIKNLKKLKRINVNLNKDNLYKIRIK